MRRWLALVLIGIAGGSFWLAGTKQQPLLQARRDFHLSRGEPLENTPPLVAFTTVALGGFRGIIADLLWLRASQLQQDGKYFELVQLADWITKLEPRMVHVWAFHGWNMAYNVSVLFNEPTDRWRWVRQGIGLLRDEGLKYNPGEPRLYRELGWIYQHKMSGNTDQMNVYYKRWWADEMEALFEGPRPDYQRLAPDRAERMKEVYKLDPALMEQVEREYGPLDWRLPQAHAIYWAWRALPLARGFDKVQLDRMIFQTMADAAFQGDLFSNPVEGVFITGPNLALISKTRRAYEQAIAANPGESSMESGHRNFLRTAVLVLYTHHRLAEARDVLEDLRRRYPAPEYNQGLDRYVFSRMTEFIQELGQREALNMVAGTLQQSWFWLAMGDEEQAQGYQQLARSIWREYMKTRLDPEVAARAGLPPLEQLNQQARDAVEKQLQSQAAKDRLTKPTP
ncbi:MAG: hypothetical protein PCFJNLEI_04115 [Verrucomicrobiae bacterium]|nr:hypothetical protein [Verrucomicrobiae bacterium]